MSKYAIRRLLFLVLLPGLVCAGLVLFGPGLIESLQDIGKPPVPHDVETGQVYAGIEDVPGPEHRVMYLFIWADWCGVCHKTLPQLQGAWDRLQADGYTEVLIVGFNVGDSDGKIKQVRDKYGITFPMLGGGPTGTTTSFPTMMVLVDPQGIGEWEPVGQRSGYENGVRVYEMMSEMAQTIRDGLSEEETD